MRWLLFALAACSLTLASPPDRPNTGSLRPLTALDEITPTPVDHWYRGVIHLHSKDFSDGRRSFDENIQVAKQRGIALVGPTDHYDLLDSAKRLAYLKAGEKADLPVLLGTEVTYFWSWLNPSVPGEPAIGHLLAFSNALLTEGVDPVIEKHAVTRQLGLPPKPDRNNLPTLVKRIKKLDPQALVIAAHPFQELYPSPIKQLEGIEDLDGIEVFNSGRSDDRNEVKLLLDLVRAGRRPIVTAGCDSHGYDQIDRIVELDAKRWQRTTWIFGDPSQARENLRAGQCYATIGCKISETSFVIQSKTQDCPRSFVDFTITKDPGTVSLPQPIIYIDGKSEPMPRAKAAYDVYSAMVALPHDNSVHSFLIYVPGRLITTPVFLKSGRVASSTPLPTPSGPRPVPALPERDPFEIPGRVALVGQWQGQHTMHSEFFGLPWDVTYTDEITIELVGDKIKVTGHTTNTDLGSADQWADWQAEFTIQEDGRRFTLTRPVDITEAVGNWYEWDKFEGTLEGNTLRFQAHGTNDTLSDGTWQRVKE